MLLLELHHPQHFLGESTDDCLSPSLTIKVKEFLHAANHLLTMHHNGIELEKLLLSILNAIITTRDEVGTLRKDAEDGGHWRMWGGDRCGEHHKALS